MSDKKLQYAEIVEQRRAKLEKFLLECSHYDRDRLVRGAKNRGIFGDNQDDEQVYQAIRTFATTCNIKIHTNVPEMLFSKKPSNVFIESIDEDGETILKKLNQEEELREESSFLKALEKQRDILSKKLLKINQLIKLYS